MRKGPSAIAALVALTVTLSPMAGSANAGAKSSRPGASAAKKRVRVSFIEESYLCISEPQLGPNLWELDLFYKTRPRTARLTIRKILQPDGSEATDEPNVSRIRGVRGATHGVIIKRFISVTERFDVRYTVRATARGRRAGRLSGSFPCPNPAFS